MTTAKASAYLWVSAKYTAILTIALLWFYLDLAKDLVIELTLELEHSVVTLSELTTSLDIPTWGEEYRSLARPGESPVVWDNITTFALSAFTLFVNTPETVNMPEVEHYPLVTKLSDACCSATYVDWVEWLETLNWFQVYNLAHHQVPSTKAQTRRECVRELVRAYAGGSQPYHFDYTSPFPQKHIS